MCVCERERERDSERERERERARERQREREREADSPCSRPTLLIISVCFISLMPVIQSPVFTEDKHILLYISTGNPQPHPTQHYKNIHGAALHELNEIVEEDVSVALTEAVSVVGDLASVVVDDETHAGALEVFVGANSAGKFLSHKQGLLKLRLSQGGALAKGKEDRLITDFCNAQSTMMVISGLKKE